MNYTHTHTHTQNGYTVLVSWAKNLAFWKRKPWDKYFCFFHYIEQLVSIFSKISVLWKKKKISLFCSCLKKHWSKKMYTCEAFKQNILKITTNDYILCPLCRSPTSLGFEMLRPHSLTTQQFWNCYLRKFLESNEEKK